MIAKGILGRSFKGTAAYLLHDKAHARTAERVAWTHTENLISASAAQAWREMIWTTKHADTLKRESGQSSAGRKAELPVYHLSLSWAPDETPGREEMVSTARDALKTLGLENHQALIVCHNDEPHSHVHILVNRVNPETGVMNRLSRSNIKLSAWALDYEKTQGRVRCAQRIESNRALARSQQPRHSDQVIRDAWSGSDSGRAFQSALAEQGYILARGNARIVVVDPAGKAINPTRQLRGVKAAEVKARLQDLDTKALPSVEDAQARQRERVQETERESAAVITQERAVGKKEAQVQTLREAFAEAAGGAAADVSRAEKTGASEARAEEVPLREDYNAAWEQAVAEAAIAKEAARAAREAFAEAARQKMDAVQAQEAPPADAGSEEPPLREDYNADWEQAVIEAAIEQEAVARHTRERKEKAAQGDGKRARTQSRAAARKHLHTDRQAPAPVNDNAGLSGNERRALMQSRHFDEQIELERGHHRARLAQFERLAAVYDTRVFQEQLRELERKRFKMPWHKKQMEALRKTIENAASRHQEAQNAFTNPQAREYADLLMRQAQERLVLEREIAALPEAEPEAQTGTEPPAQEIALSEKIRMSREARSVGARHGGRDRDRDFER